MSEATKGWARWAVGRYRKHIDIHSFECNRMSPGRWYLAAGSQTVHNHRPTLRECQELAHDTAKLWKGKA